MAPSGRGVGGLGPSPALCVGHRQRWLHWVQASPFTDRWGKLDWSWRAAKSGWCLGGSHGTELTGGWCTGHGVRRLSKAVAGAVVADGISGVDGGGSSSAGIGEPMKS